MVYTIGIFLDHEGTKRYVFFGVLYNTIMINAAMNSSLDAAVIRVKVDNGIGEIGISHE